MPIPENRQDSPTRIRAPRSGVTRRTFLKGAGALGIAVAAIDMTGCKGGASGSGAGDPTVVDSGAATDVIESYKSSDSTPAVASTWTLSLGCVPRAAEGTWIPILATGNSADQMNKGSVLSLSSGSVADVVTSCSSGDSGWVIFDVRCSDKVYAWVELNLVTRAWALFAQPFSDGALSGKATKLQDGDAAYDPPQVVCAGERVIGQTMPSTSGKKTTEHSFCYVWGLGGSKASAVVDSPGRFGCAPSVSGSTITLVPRVNADEGTFYGITAYDLSDDLSTTIDRLVLPSSVKPFYATRIGDDFAFSIEANYDSGGLLGQMGTYIGTSKGPFVTLSREPAAQVAGTKDGTFVIKSRASYFVVDTKEKTYAVLSAIDHALDYGEYPATEGLCSTFVTFSTVKDTETGYPANVVVRAFGL